MAEKPGCVGLLCAAMHGVVLIYARPTGIRRFPLLCPPLRYVSGDTNELADANQLTASSERVFDYDGFVGLLWCWLRLEGGLCSARDCASRAERLYFEPILSRRYLSETYCFPRDMSPTLPSFFFTLLLRTSRAISLFWLLRDRAAS